MKYIGVKVLRSAKLMTRAEYVAIRGWEMPENENPNEEVYMVEYEPTVDNKTNLEGYEGYVTMSPKLVFEEAYKPMNGMTFGLAVEALKKGAKVARKGWNGKGMWVMLVEGRTIEDAMSAEFADEDGTLTIASHIDMFSADKKQVVGWLASQTDMLAEDWVIVD
jgi:hypothetical protein|tara:strand:- start:9609 stop:10100 length:492 start_codon:yes stop_codon:yes gene_type:complete